MDILPWSPRTGERDRGRPGGTGGVPLSICLLGIVVAVALPLLALVSTTIWVQYRNERAHAEAQLQAQARGMSLQVDAEISAVKTVARTLANSAALARGDMPAFEQEMQAAKAALSTDGASSDAMVRIRLIGSDGMLRYDTLYGTTVVSHEQPFGLRAITTGKPQISDLFIGQPSHLPFVAIAVPVFAPQTDGGPDHRHAVGAVAISILRDRLRAIADAAVVPAGGTAAVLDRNGLTIADSLNDAAMVDKPAAPAVLRAILHASSGLIPATRSQDGTICTLAFARAPVSGFVTTLDLPERVFLEPVRRVVFHAAAIAAAVLVFSALLALFFGRRIAGALRRVPAMAADQARGATLRPTGLREADTLAAVLGETLARRARAEDRLAESEERLRLAVDAADVGLWDVDPIADRVFWPPRVKAMFGISADMPVSMADFYAGLHPDDHARVASAYAAALDPARRGQYDVTFRTIGREDGTIRWVSAKGRGMFDDSGRCVRVIGTCIDTTVRRATARQLRELNETLEQRVSQATQERDRVWRNSRDLLVVADGKGTLRAVNPAVTPILGYTPQEVIGHRFLHFVWPAEAGLARRGFEAAMTGNNLTSFQVQFRHKDGTARRLSWNTTREGDLLYAYGRDITAEKAAAAELAAAQEALHQAQKIETIGQLTGGVAHDFNNLLTPIVGALDILSRRTEGNARAQRIVGAAMQAADRARTLIQRLLAFSRRQHLEARAVDVRGLIESLADLASRSLGPQIGLILRIAGDLPPARVDPNQLELALLNLAVNARDAMGGVGTVTITATEQTTALPGKLLAGRYIRIAVADTGCGMDAETLKRAVEPFFTTKQDGRGTGLGLSMVHGLAEQSGGSFALQSAPGEGTTALLWLPISEEIAIDGPPDASASPAAPSQRAATILLVDDEELVRTGVADMLADAGYTVAQADSGLAAVGMVKAGLRPDALVTDYAMPGMTGVELVRILRGLLPTLPVLMVTGYAKLNAGEGDDLPRLGKPFRQADLIAAVSALLRKERVLEGTW